MLRCICSLTLVTTICFISFIHAQQIIKIPFNKKIGPDNGLSSYNASKVLQDNYGFTWIAMQDGLNRYDGNEIIIYNKSSITSHRLLGNVINDIALDTAREMLWVTTSYGGLNGIDLVTGTVIHTLPGIIRKNGFRNDWLKCINVCNGLVWIGTYDGLYLYNPDSKILKEINGMPATRKPVNVNTIYPDRSGHVWVLYPDYGLSGFDCKGKLLTFLTCSQLNLHEKQSYLQIGGRLVVLSDTSFMLATDNGFTRIGYDKNLQHIIVERKLHVNNHAGKLLVASCAIDNNGLLWYTTGGHLYRSDMQDGSFKEIRDISYNKGGNWLNAIFYIFFDNQNNIWLGTQQGVTFTQNVPAPFIPYFEDPVTSVRINHANYIFPENDSILLVGAPNGFYKINRNVNSIHQVEAGYSYDYIFRHPDGHLIVSGENGLMVYNGERLLPAYHYYPELTVISNESVNSAVPLRAGVLMLGSETNNGIYCWFTELHTLTKMSLKNDSFPNTIINNMYKDIAGQVWILYDNAIAVLDTLCFIKKRWQPEDPDLKAPLNIYFDICEAAGDYWIAVYGKGVIRMDRNFKIRKIYSTEEGLLNTGVYKIFPYHDSLIFVSSNKGLYSIDIKKDNVFQYLKEDGLNTNSFEERCGYLKGEHFFAGGVEGVSVITPAYIRNNTVAPRLYINQISIQGKERLDSFNLLWQSLDIANDALQVTVSFSAINYPNPSRTIFAYRIKEMNSEWIQLGTKHFVALMGLPPGEYSLEVKAANESNIWCAPSIIKLHFRPKWYQTMGFKIATALTILFIFYGIYNTRLNQIRKQQQIRKNFANDLHDDIGSTLNSVKIFTHMAMREAQNKNHLLQIEDLLQQAAIGIRDMIWVLDDSQDTVIELLDRVKKITLPVTLAAGIEIVFKNELYEIYRISKREKRNLLLLMKEAINNSIKHADCTTINITISTINRKRKFIIKDNGRGFDTTALKCGNGLENMKDRARQAGYIFVVESGTAGTIITLTAR